MKKGILQNRSWALFVVCWLAAMFVLTMLLLLLMGVCLDNWQSVSSMRWTQLGQTFSLFILPALIMAYLWSEQPWQFLQLHRTPGLRNGGWAVAIMLLALPAINLLGYLNQQLQLPAFLESIEQLMQEQEQLAEQVTNQLLSGSTWYILLLNILLIGLLPAMGEELCFRGILQWLFTRKGSSSNTPHLAIWCTALVFSFVHFQFYGFIPRLLMGALFGYAVVWTGSLWIPILMHFVNNATVVILTYLTNNAYIAQVDIEQLGIGDTLWLGLSSLVVTGLMIMIWQRWSRSNDDAPER